MVIDFHTHIYPDKIAEKTISYLSKKGNILPQTKGTREALLNSMKENNVDLSVVLPVATKPSQVETINRVSKELNNIEGTVYAGGIHPDSENIDVILDGIKEAGLFGIKIHPDYQDVYFDDPRYIKIIEACAERNLIVITHAGLDIGFPEDVHCTPTMVLNVLDKLKGKADGKIVLAHMGAYDNPKEVLEKLAGLDIYFDTSAVLDLYPDECVEIIKKHGSEKILFGTDSPWGAQGKYVEIIKSFPISDIDKENILCENAKRLLNM